MSFIVGSARTPESSGHTRRSSLGDIKAVKGRKVFVNPSGAYLWDRHSAEAALQVLFFWAAKTLHPDRFADLASRKKQKPSTQYFPPRPDGIRNSARSRRQPRREDWAYRHPDCDAAALLYASLFVGRFAVPPLEVGASLLRAPGGVAPHVAGFAGNQRRTDSSAARRDGASSWVRVSPRACRVSRNVPQSPGQSRHSRRDRGLRIRSCGRASLIERSARIAGHLPSPSAFSACC